MDTVTTAIIAALAVGVTGGVTQVSQQVIVDGYNRLKELLKNKFGAHSDVVNSVEALEAKPDSKGRKETLQEEVIATKADQDPDILQVAQKLLDQMSKLPKGEQHIQQAIGNYNAQADRGSRASVNVNQPKDS